MYKNYICPICESRLVGQRYCPSCKKMVEPLIYSGKYLPNEHSDRCLVEPKNDKSTKKTSSKKINILPVIAVIIGLLPGIISFGGAIIDEFSEPDIDPENYSNPEFIEAVLDNYIDKNIDKYEATGCASYYVDEDFVNEWGEPGTGYQCFDVDYEGFIDQFPDYSVEEGDSLYSVELLGSNYLTYYNHIINLSDSYENNIEIEYDEISKQVIQVRYEQTPEDGADVNFEIPLSIAKYLDSYDTITEDLLQEIFSSAEDEGEMNLQDVDGMSIYVEEYEDTISWSFERKN